MSRFDTAISNSPASAAAAASSSSHTLAASSSPVPAALPSPSAFPSMLGLSHHTADNPAHAATGLEDTDPLRPCWQPGAAVPFVFLSRLYNLIEHENGRIKIINWLSYAFWQILAYTPSDLPAALFLSSDQLAPSYENHSLGFGGSTLVSLVSEITSVSRKQLHADHARLGDLGLIAAQYRLTQKLLFRPAPLTVTGVFATFHAMGEASRRDKKEDMLVSASLSQ